MCSKKYRAQALVSGPWIDTHTADEVNGSSAETDLSYWTEFGLSYDPECYPLAPAELVQTLD